jgi:MoaA/NifB/PqqE/SkfB family radical SAM enzyme
MIEGREPTICSKCFDRERVTGESARTYHRRDFQDVLDAIPDITEPDGTCTTMDMKYWDFRFSNLCNFKCRSCGPAYSSAWVPDATKLGYADQDKVWSIDSVGEQTNYDFLIEQIDNVRRIYFAGGEPLLMKENLELLKELNPDVNLRINTNLSKVDTGVFDAVCRFKNVHWTVSAETIEDEFEYIRFGGMWQDFLDNLNTIKKLDHKISFNIIWFLLNYDSVFDYVDYLKRLGFHNNSFIIGALLNPDYLNIRHLPKHVLNLLKIKLKSKINEQPGYLLEDSYRNMLYYIQQTVEQDLAGSFEQLAILDQRRGVDSSKIFIELYKLKEGK